MTSNAIHEFGHVFIKSSYSDWLAGGFIQLVNEGLPTFFEQVIRNDVRYPSSSDSAACGHDRFIDLSSASLRTMRYCQATPFWNFLATYSARGAPAPYARADLTTACQTYRRAIENPMPGVMMRRIPGRDLVLDVLDGFNQCYPIPNDGTPTCTVSRVGRRVTLPIARCARGAPVQDKYIELAMVPWRPRTTTTGCRPSSPFGEGLHGQGELAMPLVMDIIDHVARQHLSARGLSHPVLTDGIDFGVFREYLQWNYGRSQDAAGTPRTWGAASVTSSDADGFRLPAFGAHYHEVDLASGSVRIQLTRQPDLPRWAFAVYYRYPCSSAPGAPPCFAAAATAGDPTASPWRDDAEAELVVGPRTIGGVVVAKAVVIVTAFEGVYDPNSATAYLDAFGHYTLSARPIGVRR